MSRKRMDGRKNHSGRSDYKEDKASRGLIDFREFDCRSVQTMRSAARRNKTLPPDEQIALFKQYVDGGRTDKKLENKLYMANIRMAAAFAYNWNRINVPYADLLQEAHIGLYEAVRRFDPYMNRPFTNYAFLWMRQCIQHFICNMRGTITFSHANKLEKPLGVKYEGIDAVNDEGVVTEADIIHLDYMRHAKTIIDDVLTTYDEDQQFVINARVLTDEKPLPHEKIGQKFGYTRENARQRTNKLVDSFHKRVRNKLLAA